MGRASRKKNRLRGIDGGVYSKLWKHEKAHKTFKAIESGKSVMFKDGSSIPTMLELFNYILEHDLGNAGVVACSISFLEYQKYLGDYHNYFITDESLVLFLENQIVKDDDHKNSYSIIDEYCPIVKTEGNAIVKHVNIDVYCGVIHLINRKDSIAFSFMASEGNTKASSLTCISNEGGMIGSYIENSISEILKEAMPEQKRVMNIVLNMFLYIDAFPEAIKAGPPPVRRLDLIKSLSNTTIGETEAIRGLYDGSHHVSPHLRRGHYRFLKSDRYKKKRFQTVFVRPAMVKGTADHIIDVDKVAV